MASAMSPAHLKHASRFQQGHQLDHPPSGQAGFLGEAGIGQVRPTGLQTLMTGNELNDVTSRLSLRIGEILGARAFTLYHTTTWKILIKRTITESVRHESPGTCKPRSQPLIFPSQETSSHQLVISDTQ